VSLVGRFVRSTAFDTRRKAKWSQVDSSETDSAAVCDLLLRCF
jgi:hypothetical protein